MTRRWNPTFGQLFLFTLAGLAILLGALFWVVLANSRRTLIQSAQRQREDAAERIGNDVIGFLDGGLDALVDIEREAAHQTLLIRDDAALEKTLYNELMNRPDISEITITHAQMLGYDPAGEAKLAPGDRWQISVFRSVGTDGLPRVVIRRVLREAGGYVATLRSRNPDDPFDAPSVPVGIQQGVDDPTDHPTFTTPISKGDYGTLDWTDLHRSQIDSSLPEDQRRPEVSVLRAIEDSSGTFVGVVRVGLFTQQLTQVVAQNNADDPHRAVLCDSAGRLIVPLTPGDLLQDSDGDLRYQLPATLPEVAAALKLPELAGQTAGSPPTNGEVSIAGQNYLVTFRPLGHSQDWIVAVIGPEAYYLRGLEETRRQLLVWSAGVIAVVLLAGFLTLRIVHQSLGRVTAATSRMREFDFTAGPTRTPLRDVEEVMESLEQAKTAMRAMGKYVPVDLVRSLYQSNREPMLGGEPMTVSMMFSDIRDFTTLAEQMSGDDLALALGQYFQAMTRAVQDNGGIVDKYIGDSVMALWNVPRPRADHPADACRAALACLAATDALDASAEKGNLPRFFTRIGLHCATVMVGHFGAPDRMSYTALGDGVNLASRLEGLNKIYGTKIIASEAIRQAAGDGFCFRLLDVVAVKGKTQGVRIFELTGTTPQGSEHQAIIASYERALDLYWHRDFAHAATVLAAQAAFDAPSRVLHERCLQLTQSPPAADWNGVYIATTK
jgi:adenylate cyclase